MPRKILVGEVLHLTKMGYIVVKISNPNIRLRLGSVTIDDNDRKIGRLVDIIGNIEKPYAIIKMEARQPSPGSKVYLVVRVKRRPRKGKKKGKRGARKSVRGRGRMQARKHNYNSRRNQSM